MTGPPILTAGEMRAAEAVEIARGTSAEIFMERAGAGAAEAIRRFAGPLPTLVLCGPGNNGGDGYVVARLLREGGAAVRVAALGPPATDAARAALQRWGGAVEPLDEAAPAPLLVDALFGTGLARPLEDRVSRLLSKLANQARVKVAIDLPSGAASDDGALLSPVPVFDLTITFASLKPSHLLQPAARFMGRLVVADIGVAAQSRLSRIARPRLAAPGPDDHKYRRGYVAVVAGAMPGAAALAASAAARSGAGYVRIFAAGAVAGVPLAIVQSGEGPLEDERIGAIVIGPGLGRGGEAQTKLEQVLDAALPAILDADALAMHAGFDRLRRARHMPILTPHEGEFVRLFPDLAGSKFERARAAAARANCVIVHKGADTVVAAPDGRAAIAGQAPHWLASAGTGDVLAGIVAAMRARGLEAFEAAVAAVWLHGEAAERAGPVLIADDLVAALPAVVARCQ